MSWSFLFRLLHKLHPTRSRLHRLSPRTNPSPFCQLCDNHQVEDDLFHSLSLCHQSSQAMGWLTATLKMFDPTITPEKILQLQIFPTNNECLLECVFLVAESLSYVWAQRQSKEQIDLAQMISTIKAKCYMLSKSWRVGSHGTNLIAVIDT